MLASVDVTEDVASVVTNKVSEAVESGFMVLAGTVRTSSRDGEG